MKKRTWSILLTLGVCLAIVASAPAAVVYDIIELGTLGGMISYALGINEYGQVVGSSTTSSGEGHAFLWDSVNGMQDIGTLGGNYSVALRINNSGQVVGRSSISSGKVHAFLWDSTNGMQDIGVEFGRLVSFATDINNFGQVAAYGYDGYYANRQAFLWDSVNGAQPLHNLVTAMGINDSGQVAGGYIVGDCHHAAVWDSINGVQDIGTLGGCYSSSLDINNSAQVVGVSTASSGGEHAFLWDSINGMRDLGTLGGGRSEAYGINDCGQVVGYCGNQAFIWDSVNGMQGLGTLGGLNSEARDINNSGQIVGLFVPSSDISHAILLQPVPEPATLLLLGLGGLTLLRNRRFR